jgi:hypothetical protein
MMKRRRTHLQISVRRGVFRVEFVLADFIGVGHSLFGIDDHGISIAAVVDVDSSILFSLDVVGIDVGQMMSLMVGVSAARHVEKVEE